MRYLSAGVILADIAVIALVTERILCRRSAKKLAKSIMENFKNGIAKDSEKKPNTPDTSNIKEEDARSLMEEGVRNIMSYEPANASGINYAKGMKGEAGE